LRGVAAFDDLWQRRTTMVVPASEESDLEIDVMSLPDLVASRKTQQDKDWPMIRRLVEANYLAHRAEASHARLSFWLRELRTPELLTECVALNPEQAALEAGRPAVTAALRSDAPAVQSAIADEENEQRRIDREYWAPLRAELEQLRRQKQP
jgi:hypothetical protein